MPDRVGHYQIKRELGRGGMGTVFEAVDDRDGRTVALKILPPELARDAAFVRRFQREIAALRKLDHPGIVKFIEFGAEGGFYYYSMEYVDGHSLQAVLERVGRIDPLRACGLGSELCDALEHAHQRGIVHRDIKPGNILIDSKGHAHLTDFGIARVVEATRMTTTGGIVGTAEYMSPEQAEGRRVDRRSDVYSLGVVLYRALTGRVPFGGKTLLEVMQQHRFAVFERPREFNPEIPASLSSLIEEMLAKQPDKRPASAGLVNRALQAVRRTLESGAAGLAESLFQKAQAQQAAEEPVRYRGLYFRASVYLAVVALLVGWAIWQTLPSSASTLMRRGKTALDQGYPSDAMGYLHELVERYPNAPDAPEAGRLLEEARKQRYEHGKDLSALVESVVSGAAKGLLARRPIEVLNPKISAGELAYARAMRDRMNRRWDDAARKFDAVAVLFETHEPKIAASARRVAEEIAASQSAAFRPATQSAPASKGSGLRVQGSGEASRIQNSEFRIEDSASLGPRTED